MSEEEATEKQIDEFLETVMESDTIDVVHTIKAFAKILFNLRFDLNELKQELIKTFSEEDGYGEEEYLPESEDDLQKIEPERGRFYNDFYA